MAVEDINTIYKNEFGNIMTLLFDYSLADNQDEIKKLVENTIDIHKPNYFGHSPIYQLSREGVRNDIMELAISKGADIEHVDPETGCTALLTALYGRQYNTVKYLVFKGSNVNVHACKYLYCDFPLYIAARNGKYDIVLLLLNAGADINLTNFESETALHIAVKRNHVDIVKLLLEKGARTDLRNTDGKTPVDIAREKENQELYTIFKNNSVECISTELSDLKLDPSNELVDD